MPKLTLSVDPAVVARAKRYAQRQGVSVSSIVEAYLASVSSSVSQTQADAPVLRALRGSLRKAGIGDYKRHLAAKYR